MNRGGKGEERISVEWLVRKASRSTLMTFKKKENKMKYTDKTRGRQQRLKMTRLWRATLWVTYVHHLLPLGKDIQVLW